MSVSVYLFASFVVSKLFICFLIHDTDLVLLGVEDEVDQGHQVPLVGAEVGPVSAGAHAIEEDQVLGSGGGADETHVWQQNLVKSDGLFFVDFIINVHCPLSARVRQVK